MTVMADRELVRTLADTLQGKPPAEIERVIQALRAELTQRERLPKLIERFDAQVHTLLARDYPGAAGMPVDEFLRYIHPLKERLQDLEATNDGCIPFLIIIPAWLVPLHAQCQRIVLDGKAGYISEQIDLCAFRRPMIELSYCNAGELVQPCGPYLAIDVETGERTLGMTRVDFSRFGSEQGRISLTVEELTALAMHAPGILKNRSIVASGTSLGDDRCPSIELDGDKKPRLASCRGMVARETISFGSCRKRLL